MKTQTGALRHFWFDTARRTVSLFVLCAALLIATTSFAQGGDDEQEPLVDFIHLMNIPGRCQVGGLCAATATVNGFGYLLTTDPGAYAQTSLLKNGDPALTRDTLAAGWISPDLVFRTGMGDQGAYDRNWWEALNYWFQDYAPGTTYFQGMDNVDTSSWVNGSAITKGLPTYSFLLGQLHDKEVVTFKIVFHGVGCPDAGCAHALTLLGLKSTKPKGGGVRTITYLDPNAPNQALSAVLYTDPDGGLGFFWNNAGNPPRDAEIMAAFAESPIPEPGTLVLFGSASVGVAGFLRKRQVPRSQKAAFCG